MPVKYTGKIFFRYIWQVFCYSFIYWYDYMKLNDAGYFIMKQGRRWRCSGSTSTDDDAVDGKIDSSIWLHIVGSVH